MRKEKPKCDSCGKKTRKPVGACSECAALEAADKKKGSKISKVYFWLFVTLGIMAAFLIWSSRGEAFINDQKSINASFLAAIISILLSLMFGMFVFVRFIRNRSIAGGLFLTVAISTVVFFGTSQIVGAIIPPTAAAMTGNSADAANTSYAAIIGLAQVGLFTLWFCFLLLAISTQVSPVKKIDKILAKIIDGDGVKRVHIGKSKQYRAIAEKLEAISAEVRKRNDQEAKRKERQSQQKQRAIEKRAKMQEIQKHQEERLSIDKS
jgi:hypothetical protein